MSETDISTHYKLPADKHIEEGGTMCGKKYFVVCSSIEQQYLPQKPILHHTRNGPWVKSINCDSLYEQAINSNVSNKSDLLTEKGTGNSVWNLSEEEYQILTFGVFIFCKNSSK